MKTCCLIGHRNVQPTAQLSATIKATLTDLIESQNVRVFLFGSKSQFNSLCQSVSMELKKDYPEIRLVYVRSQYPIIPQYYTDYLLEFYDDTYMPSHIEQAGRATYTERNQAMINASDFCVFYYDENYKPPKRKYAKNCVSFYQPNSGTKLAYLYAKQKKKTIINVFTTQEKHTI